MKIVLFVLIVLCLLAGWNLASANDIRVIISLFVSVVAAIGACVGGLGAWRSASRTQLAAEGRLLFEQLQDYASKDMRDHLRILFKWDREKVGKDKSQRDAKAKGWVETLFDKEHGEHEDADNLDEARRHVTHYFINIHQLWESGYVEEYFLKGVCRAASISVLDINFPLEKALKEYLDKQDGILPEKTKETLEKLKKKFEKFKELSKDDNFRN
jgi:hypothetical protein